MYNVWFVVGLLSMAALLLIEHWFPWPKRLHRLFAYPLGTGAILVGVAIWLEQTGYGHLIRGIIGFALVAGIVVYGAYGIDWLVIQIRKGWKAEQLVGRMTDDDRPT